MNFSNSIRNLTTSIVGGNKKSSSEDYKEANYYNYYRILEKKPEDQSRRLCGLYNGNNTIGTNIFKLTDFTIETEINDSCSTSVWTQIYDNESTTPIEGKYQIPLHPLSVVSNFIIEYQDKVLQGKIKEKTKALEKYNDTIASGGQAFLAQKTDNNYFNLSIGNLPPKEKVTVKIVITSELGQHLGALHYCLHNYMFPSTNFKFNLNVNIKLSIPIKSIECSYYNPTIKYKEGSEKKEAEFSISNSGIKKPIIATITPIETNEPNSIIECIKNNEDNKSSYAMAINFFPSFKDIKLDEINQKSEFIFVIDCSGSMSGSPILKAKRALEIIVRSLNENHKINIYCFGSSFTKAFKESQLYDDDSLDRVGQYIEKISANLGGTELLPPIKDIFNTKSDPEYPRQVFILTDGEISERDTLINYVAKEANTTRIFTYGIGNSVDTELVIGLSKACSGYYVFIKENNEMEKQVMKLLNVAFEPMLSNIKIDWSSSGLTNVINAPSTIRPLFNHERMIVYSLVNSSDGNNSELINSSILNKKPLTVKLIGDGPKGNSLSFEINLDFSNNNVISTSNQVHILSAFKYIQDLEEDERKNKSDNKDKIVEYGKKFGLVSNHTSYIVTADSDNVTEETMKTVDVLNQPTSITPMIRGGPNFGGGGRGGSVMRKCAVAPSSSSSFSLRSRSIAPQIDSRSSSDDSGDDDGSDYDEDEDLSEEEKAEEEEEKCKKNTKVVMKEKECKKKKDTLYKSISAPSPPRKSSFAPPGGAPPLSKPMVKVAKSTGDLLIDLLKCQKANGSWVKDLIPTQITISNDKIPTELSSTPELINIWVTIMVIAKITKTFTGEKIQWELAIQKSTKWAKLQLTKQNLSSDAFDKFLSTAKLLI